MKWNKKLGTSKRDQGIKTSKAPQNDSPYERPLSRAEQDAFNMARVAKEMGLI